MKASNSLHDRRNNPFGYHITSTQLTVKEFPGEPALPTQRSPYGPTTRASPARPSFTPSPPSSASTDSWNLLTFTTKTTTSRCNPNTTYWLYAATMGTMQSIIRNTESNDEDIESNTDWRIATQDIYRKTLGGTWDRNQARFNLKMQISGHPAPAFLVSNLDSPSTLVLFSRRTDADVSKFAQAFSAANNENGTPAEFDFHGVIVQLESDFSTASQLADSDILVTVHKDSGGQPGDLVYTLTSPATYTVPVPSGPVTFLAPPGSTLSSGITYWLKFEIAADSTFFTGLKRIDFEFATDNNEVQGPTTNNRWSIGDDSLWSPETLSWMDDSQSIQMSVLGAPHYDTLVSNIDQPSFTGTQSVSSGLKAAQSFHTPSGPLGQQYRFSSVRIIASSQNPTQATVDLHADDNGAPGDHLASFTTPGDFAPGSTVKADFIAVAPRDTLLNTDTRYWIVFSNAENFTAFRIYITADRNRRSHVP